MLEHHAYLCRVDEVIPSSVKDFVGRLNVSEINYLEVESFGIDDVRNLTEKAFVRPIIGDKQIIVVCIKNISIEAQQALLKILEEPPSTAVFVFCVPKSLYILPTVLSRFSQESIYFDGPKKDYEAIADFLSLKIPDRITEIGKRITKKDTAWIDDIKAGLIDSLATNSRGFSAEVLSQLYFISDHLQTRGASNKLLLEELALVLNPTTEKN